jgi:hypothetical protein
MLFFKYTKKKDVSKLWLHKKGQIKTGHTPLYFGLKMCLNRNPSIFGKCVIPGLERKYTR